jgi:hypothetical protein
MNRKQLIFLLVILAVLGGAGLVLINRNKESWALPEAKMGDKVLPHFQPNAVAAIHIKGGSDLNLAHKNDLWRVQERGDYPANFHQISDVLLKLKDLKVVESDTVEPSQLARVNLDEPGHGSGSGTLVEFKDAQGKLLDSLLLGKKHMREQTDSHSPFLGGSPDGCYVLLPSDPKVVLLISDALSGLQPNPRQWLSKDFFKVEKAKSISLAASNGSNSWKLTRETESSPWILIDGRPDERLDTNKVALIVHTLAFPAFVDIAPDTAPSESGLDKPRVLTIETFDRFTYTLKVGAKSPEDNYYMTVGVAAELPDKTKKREDKLKQEQALAPWVYQVSSWILDPLLRDRAQILQGYNAEKAAAEKTSAQTDPAAAQPVWTPRVIQ